MAIIEKIQVTMEVHHRGTRPDFGNTGSLMYDWDDRSGEQDSLIIIVASLMRNSGFYP